MTTVPNQTEQTPHDRMHVRIEANRHQQSRIRDAYPIYEDALADMEYGNWQKRKAAIEMLGFLGKDKDVLRFALVENDAEFVVYHALKLLIPAHPELLVRLLTMKRDSLRANLACHVTQYNYLHAETEVLGLLATKKIKLNSQDITSLGQAGFKQSVKLIQKHLVMNDFRIYEEAIKAGCGVKDKPFSLAPITRPECYLDGPTERAIAALVAMRRLDMPVNLQYAKDLRAYVLKALPSTSWLLRMYRQQLTWVMFDAGVEACYGDLIAEDSIVNEVCIDIANTFLKRNDEKSFDSYAKQFPRGPSALVCSAFYGWPVTDALLARALIHMDELSSVNFDPYCLSRDAGQLPPPWWQWQSKWERSFCSKLLRGEM